MFKRKYNTWRRKFAFLPTALSDGQLLVFGIYYERCIEVTPTLANKYITEKRQRVLVKY